MSEIHTIFNLVKEKCQENPDCIMFVINKFKEIEKVFQEFEKWLDQQPLEFKKKLHENPKELIELIDKSEFQGPLEIKGQFILVLTIYATWKNASIEEKINYLVNEWRELTKNII